MPGLSPVLHRPYIHLSEFGVLVQSIMPPRTLLMGGHDGAQWVASTVCLTGCA